MATNTNGITTFWDTASWGIDVTNPTQSGNEIAIAYVLASIFLKLGKEFPIDATTDDMKLLGQECPTKDEIEVWLESLTTANAYINNASSYASNQLIKYSDLRYEEIVEDSISVSSSSITFPAYNDGGRSETVTSSKEWELISKSSWINCSPSNGQSGDFLFIFVQDNTTGQIRKGEIVLGCANARTTITVTQTAI